MENEKFETRTIDVTPTWSAILPAMIAVMQNGKAPAKAHREIMGELKRMARLADYFNQQVAAHKEGKA